jgi:hypothetical protein
MVCQPSPAKSSTVGCSTNATSVSRPLSCNHFVDQWLWHLKLKLTAIEDGGPQWQCVTIEGRSGSVKDVDWFTSIIAAIRGMKIG